MSHPFFIHPGSVYSRCKTRYIQNINWLPKYCLRRPLITGMEDWPPMHISLVVPLMLCIVLSPLVSQAEEKVSPDGDAAAEDPYVTATTTDSSSDTPAEADTMEVPEPGLDELDPYVVTPEQKARLEQAEKAKAAESPQADSETETPSQAPEPPAKPSPPQLNPMIKSFVESRFGQENCSAPNWCGELVELRCLKTGDGPIYYYNNDTGKLLMTCGRACINPDPYDVRDCKACPYPQWVECRERTWREQQELLRQKELEEIAQLEAEETKRKARADAILKQIHTIEQDCNEKIRELEKQLDALD